MRSSFTSTSTRHTADDFCLRLDVARAFGSLQPVRCPRACFANVATSVTPIIRHLRKSQIRQGRRIRMPKPLSKLRLDPFGFYFTHYILEQSVEQKRAERVALLRAPHDMIWPAKSVRSHSICLTCVQTRQYLHVPLRKLLLLQCVPKASVLHIIECLLKVKRGYSYWLLLFVGLLQY